jgi:hypothetical protein
MSNAGILGVAPNEIRLWVQATLDYPDTVVLFPAGWNDQAPALHQSDRELLESLQHPTALAANGCPGVIAGVCCHHGVREVRLPQSTRGTG